MTLLAPAEQIEKSLRDTADEIEVTKENTRVTCTAKIGKQAFVVIVEELEPDKRKPAV